ncbi:hypothetical protein [Dyella mobilis]|uniref:Uncharacterized protein n=1 Tax=Dyella mobilis TaxID=1849582 RepID=A0ABS2KEG1_9GAMM|nr:hypothetical protein [Dyella mobilis]MBM7129566.1 hypothetical protein [Dyella mobilis]GLQ98169.1 hypothetical protein GCM10007863_25890 [Dyella mobilis]
MYKLDRNTDFSFLAGVHIDQICVSTGASTIAGDRQVVIKIFGGFAIGQSRPPLKRFEGEIEDAVALFSLLGDGIKSANAAVDGGLELAFDSGTVLEIFSDNDQYECFTVENGDVLVVA